MLMLNKIFISLSLLLKAPEGSAYFLLDQDQIPRYVVKFEETSTPTAHAEALASSLAQLIGLGHLTPETHLTHIQERVCSIQPYLSDIENLRKLAEGWLEQGITNEQLLSLIDQTDFEDLFLLILLYYDTDAHANNIFARKDEAGVYHLIKLDNGLTFPNKNRKLFNSLYLLPHARKKFSQHSIQIIETLPMDKIEELFIQFEMEEALEAFVERVEILEKLKNHTMAEIALYFRNRELTSSSETCGKSL
jgi:hypothetical protein